MMLFGTIRHGRLDLDRDVIREHIREMGDCDVLISIEKLGNKRSERQNAYYWAVVIPYAVRYFRDAGWDCDEESVHHVFKQKFLGRVIVNVNTGEQERYYGSTAKLDTQSFNDYIEECRMWVSQNLGGFIPDPE